MVVILLSKRFLWYSYNL